MTGTGLLICAAVGAVLLGAGAMCAGYILSAFGEKSAGPFFAALGLALIAVALWLAYAAGGA